MSTTARPTAMNLPAAVLAWVWPGLGHISLGHRRRGRLIMLGILFMFTCGVLVGGINCVDRQNDSLWFLAQGLAGPIAFIVDFANQRLVNARPEDEALMMRSFGLPNDMGTLFCALAGLMNFVAVLDAFARPAAKEPDDRPRRRASDQPTSGDESSSSSAAKTSGGSGGGGA